jgi:hypothetical protein
MRQIVRKWTEEDITKLKQLMDEGATLLRAAAALNRGSGSVQKKARELGKTFASVRQVRAGIWPAERRQRNQTAGGQGKGSGELVPRVSRRSDGSLHPHCAGQQAS